MTRHTREPWNRLLWAALALAASVASGNATTSLTPSTVNLNPGQTVQFHLSVDRSLTPSTADIGWFIWPSLGTITNSGLYTAPSSVTAAQSTRLTVRIVPANTSLTPVVVSSEITVSPTVSAPVSVSVTPQTATVSNAGTVQFTAAVSNSTNKAVNWTISPAVGTISSSGLYTAPASITSQATVVVKATSQAVTSQSGSATLTLNPPTAPTGPTANTITLPIEVLGADGTTTSVQVNVPSGTNVSQAMSLLLQMHGLEYQTQASAQVNSSAWIAINNTNAQVQGLAKNYGGIGGGFSTVTVLLPLPSGTVKAGVNTINFKFNGTDGNSDGFRVLALNVEGADGTQLLPASDFTQDNPSAWTPPSTAQSDIAAGQTLYQTGAIFQPQPGGGTPKPLKAHCGDCHTADGRDLKYFNYSNNSISARAQWHGLNSTQAKQVASYIRSLSTPAPSQGRPWNPPYQPGPGLDSQPVTNWSAGAGISAVLSSDAAMLPYFTPNQSAADFSATGNVSQRVIPIAFQLPDWNHWLPKIHPLDAFGSSFTSSQLNQDYLGLKSSLIPGNAAAYNQSGTQFAQLDYYKVQFLQPLQPPASSSAWQNPATATAFYSASLWVATKTWELNQEFGLEGMSQQIMGPQADPRAWYSNVPFSTSPNFNNIPEPVAGIGNGSQQSATYISFMWYYLQIILDDGNRVPAHIPVDWGYLYNFMNGVSGMSSLSAPQASLLLFELLKALQTSQDGAGPQLTSNGGWDWTENDPSRLLTPDSPLTWTGLSSSTQSALINAYLSAWYAAVSQFTPQQFYKGGFTSPTDPVTTGPGMVDGSWPSKVAYMIPHLRYAGLSPALAQSIDNWAASMWPSNGYNWSRLMQATCTTNGQSITCSSDN